MTRKSKIGITILILILFLGGIWYYWSFSGYCSGRVYDAETGKPIEGAVISVFWKTSIIFGVVGDGFGALYATKTKEDGSYYIPSQRIEREYLIDPVYPEDVIIYKQGYAVYKVYREYGRSPVGLSYGYTSKTEQPYSKKNNKVLLYPLHEISKEDNWDYARTGCYDELLEEQIRKDRGI